MVFGKNSDTPASLLAAQGMHLGMKQQEEHRRRSVTDLVTFLLCPRYARQFSQEHYPAQTPATVLGHILHRTIKHLYDRYHLELEAGNNSWLPDEEMIREECQMAENAVRAQGLPRLSLQQQTQLQRILTTFHALEASTFYPRIQAAEVSVEWIWKEAPGGPLLLEGKVDVVVEEHLDLASGIALWDYKTTRRPDPGKEMQYYQWQMDLYALLYQRTYGVKPQGTVLYFMGELNHAHLIHRPESAVLRLPADPQREQRTLDLLRWALEQELICRANSQWNPPSPEQVPERLCRHCLIRWSCPSVHFSFPWQNTMQQNQELNGVDL